MSEFDLDSAASLPCDLPETGHTDVDSQIRHSEYFVNPALTLYRAAMTNLRESGTVLDPRFDSNGLITAVVTDHLSGDVLMVAHMNAQALDLTRETGIAHFWSRSRQSLWKKGETSGHFLHVVEMRVDCDQDAIWVRARPDGPACHTGETSCFYRRVTADGLERVLSDAG